MDLARRSKALPMRPARQGDFDSLCGIYAIMNALELVGVAGPRRGLHRQLFRKLVAGLGPSGIAAGMHHGLTAADLKRASKPAFKWLSGEHAICLKLTQPFAAIEFFDAVDFVGALRVKTYQPETALIVQFQCHGSAHWTVAKTVGWTTIALRDSFARREIEISRFGLDRGPRFFRPADTLLLCRR